MNEPQKVYVALSGGVDSAVSAVHLLNEGYEVTGIFMQTWKDPNWMDVLEESKTPEQMAAAVAKSLGIPFVCLDVRDRFYQQVVWPFIQEYLSGKTPNPCLFCNPQVKWGILQRYAIDHGADYFATGHYARRQIGSNELVWLLRGVDQGKDQSYVLSMLTQAQLSRSLLPLGELTKEEVRLQAQALDLPVADRQESQDLCFLGDIDYRDLLQRFAPEVASPGEIVNTNGEVLGEHQGLAYYTIGQRKGIRIAASHPYYVVSKDTVNNRLIVGFAEQASKRYLNAIHPNWISGESPAEAGQYEVMVRYREQPVPAVFASVSEDEFRLELSRPLRGITPGQVAVLYQGEVCLGGGIIERAW
jgi:tRNA-uridine 2-sulfurtransferase